MHDAHPIEKMGTVEQRCKRSLSEITIDGITHSLAKEQRTLHKCRYSGFKVYEPVNSGTDKKTTADDNSVKPSEVVTIPVKEIHENNKPSGDISTSLLTAWSVAAVFIFGAAIMVVLLLLRRRKVKRRKKNPKQVLPDPNKPTHESKRDSLDNISGIYAEIDESQIKEPQTKDPLLVAERPKNEYISTNDMAATYLDPRESDGYLAPQDVDNPGTSKLYSPLHKRAPPEYGSLGDSMETLSLTKDSIKYHKKKLDDSLLDTSASLNNYFILEKEDENSSVDRLPNNYFVLEKDPEDTNSLDSSSVSEVKLTNESGKLGSQEHLSDSGYINEVGKNSVPVIPNTGETNIDSIEYVNGDSSHKDNQKGDVTVDNKKIQSANKKKDAEITDKISDTKTDKTVEKSEKANAEVKSDTKLANVLDTVATLPGSLVIKPLKHNSNDKKLRKGTAGANRRPLLSDSSTNEDDDESALNEAKPLLVKTAKPSDKTISEVDERDVDMIQSPGDNEKRCLITTV